MPQTGLLLAMPLLGALSLVAAGLQPEHQHQVQARSETQEGAGSIGAKSQASKVAELTAIQIDNLATLARVWGFLKYHHPRVTSGKLDWDAELLRRMPEIMAAKDRDSAHQALLAWFEELGEPEYRLLGPAAMSHVQLRADLAWLEDTECLGAEVQAFLKQVYALRHSAGDQKYVSHVPGVWNPDFGKEDGYAELERIERPYRLLALFRYWNIIAYWFPYRDLIDGDWNSVLPEFIPRLAAANSGEAYRLVLIELIGRIHDTHANLWNGLEVRPPRGRAALPYALRFVEGRAVVVEQLGNRALFSDGLEIGDVITSLDGKPIAEIVQAWCPWYPASNEAARLRDLADNLPRGAPEPCQVRGERNGQAFERSVDRIPITEFRRRRRRSHDLPGPAFRKLTEEVAYLKLSTVEVQRIPDYLAAAEGTRGWILDLRNYPAEFVVFELGMHFVLEETPFVRFTIGHPGNPGAFTWTTPLSLPPRAPHYPGKLVILVDEQTQSQAEYTTMAFRAAPDALVIGSTTAGADGNYSAIELPGGLRTGISGIGIFYPDKTPTQRIGIIPDIERRPTIEGIRAGRDEVLEEALHQIVGDTLGKQEIIECVREARRRP